MSFKTTGKTVQTKHTFRREAHLIMKGQDRTNSPVSTDTRQKSPRRSGRKRTVKRIILFMLATFVMVIVGSMTYVLVVPLVMMLDFPGAVSDGAEAAGSVGDRMADVTDTIQKKTEEQINANSGDGPPNTVTGTITKVVDGDTIDVDNVRIRLTLVNTPERGESGYSDAVAFTKQHCPVGTIAVYDPGREADKRIIRQDHSQGMVLRVTTRQCPTHQSTQCWLREDTPRY